MLIDALVLPRTVSRPHHRELPQRASKKATVVYVPTSRIINMCLYPFGAFLSYISQCLALLKEGGGLLCDWIEEGELLLLAVLLE